MSSRGKGERRVVRDEAGLRWCRTLCDIYNLDLNLLFLACNLLHTKSSTNEEPKILSYMHAHRLVCYNFTDACGRHKTPKSTIAVTSGNQA